MSNRFDIVEYDHASREQQKLLKQAFAGLEEILEGIIPAGRAKAMALTKLEECYLWTARGVEQAQSERPPHRWRDDPPYGVTCERCGATNGDIGTCPGAGDGV